MGAVADGDDEIAVAGGGRQGGGDDRGGPEVDDVQARVTALLREVLN